MFSFSHASLWEEEESCYEEEEEEDILTEEQMSTIEYIDTLGEGENGTVELVRLEGEVVVMKTLKKEEDLEGMKDEIRMHKKLAGAGGAPLFYGLCLDPPRIFMSCAGTSYLDYLAKCTDEEVVETLVLLADSLMEIHARDVIHNDLKADNITVTTDGELELSIIDYGLSTESGDILYVSGEPEQFDWMAPEVLAEKPTQPASDTYSYGKLMEFLIESFIVEERLKRLLRGISLKATRIDPEDRPTLESLQYELEDVLDVLGEEVEE